MGQEPRGSSAGWCSDSVSQEIAVKPCAKAALSELDCCWSIHFRVYSWPRENEREGKCSMEKPKPYTFIWADVPSCVPYAASDQPWHNLWGVFTRVNTRRRGPLGGIFKIACNMYYRRKTSRVEGDLDLKFPRAQLRLGKKTCTSIRHKRLEHQIPSEKATVLNLFITTKWKPHTCRGLISARI